jgi:hypothetical protein
MSNIFSLSDEIDIDVFNARKIWLIFLMTGAFNIVLHFTSRTPNCYCTLSLIVRKYLTLFKELERKHTIHRCLNAISSFNVQIGHCYLIRNINDIPLQYFCCFGWSTFKENITDNHPKMLKFLQATNRTWSDSTATSVFEYCPSIHCASTNFRLDFGTFMLLFC